MTAQFADVQVRGIPLTLEYAWVNRARQHAPLVVFLHEGLGSLAMWRDFPQKFCDAANLRGLVYSRWGYGRSTPRPLGAKWPGEYMHSEAQHALPALFQALAVDELPWLFGHSDGGSIALLYASAYPDRVSGLIVVAPHVFVEEVTIANIDRARVAFKAGDLQEKLSRYHADPDSAFWGWNDIWLDPRFRNWNIENSLPTIRCPVLAVQGEEDEYGTMAQLDGIARGVPQARLVKLPACGHSPQRDQPALLTAAVVQFLREHWSSTAASTAGYSSRARGARQVR